MLREPKSSVPQLPWADFYRYLAGAWRQGEHVSLIGPTGTGKTTLALAILPIRGYTVVLATKPRDATMDKLRAEGYRVVKRWEPRPGERRLVLWPTIKEFGDLATQRTVIRDALRSIYSREGNWTIVADELRYLTEQLGLKGYLQLLWLQGRSLGISLVGATQRPAWVPLELYDQATHLFFWRDTDKRNLDRIGGLGGVDSTTVRETVATLSRHEVLYVNTRDGTLYRTRVELPGNGAGGNQ